MWERKLKCWISLTHQRHFWASNYSIFLFFSAAQLLFPRRVDLAQSFMCMISLLEREYIELQWIKYIKNSFCSTFLSNRIGSRTRKKTLHYIFRVAENNARAAEPASHAYWTFSGITNFPNFPHNKQGKPSLFLSCIAWAPVSLWKTDIPTKGKVQRLSPWPHHRTN
jgi:hypothetical protein